ncbi:MAG: DUF445 domain-containing protein [Chitinispirillaceae bacterium]
MTRILIFITIPIVSAFIGWLTNAIAVRMIFRPRKEVRVLGFRIVGLIPKRKADLARKIGETVEKELISHQDIHKVVNTPEFHKEILNTIMGKIDEFIEDNLGIIPMVSMLLDGDALAGIKKRIRNELQGMLPDTMENLFSKVESRIDFKEIVRKKIEAFELSKLEGIIYSIASRELKAIEIFGGVLGFMVGIAQVGIILLGNI